MSMRNEATPAASTTSDAIRSQRRRARHVRGFWMVAVAFTLLMSFTTIPTPLYPLYQQQDHFPTFMITVIFAAYGIGVIAGLLLVGHVSDYLGRRRIILLATAIELISAILFVLFSQVPALLVARFVCGFGIGALTATATAHLAELHQIGRPGQGAAFASTVATVVNTGGLALGPLVGGLLTQWWPAPLRLPFGIYLALLALVGVAMLTVPETVADRPRAERPGYRPQTVRIAPGARSDFFAAAVGGAAAFAVLGMFTSITASFVSGTLHHTSRLLAGAIVFGVMGASALVQVLLTPVAARLKLQLGLAGMVVGLLAVALSAALLSLPLFVIAGVVAGGGVGLVFQSAIATAARLAEPEHRGETLAGMFLAAYIGITVPVVGVGVAITLLGRAVPVMIAFPVIIAVVVAFAVGRMLRGRAIAR